MLRDRWGVPHIYAKNADDLFFAQGFVAAQDRCFRSTCGGAWLAAKRPRCSASRPSRATASPGCMRYRGDMRAEWAQLCAGRRSHRHRLHPRHQRLHRPRRRQAADRVSDPGHQAAEVAAGGHSGPDVGHHHDEQLRSARSPRARLIAAVGVEKARLDRPDRPAAAVRPGAGPRPGRHHARHPGRLRRRHASRSNSRRARPRATTGSSTAAARPPASRCWPAIRTGPSPCRRCATSSTCTRRAGTSSAAASRPCPASPSATTSASPGASPSSAPTRPTSTSRKPIRTTRRCTGSATAGSRCKVVRETIRVRGRAEPRADRAALHPARPGDLSG